MESHQSKTGAGDEARTRDSNLTRKVSVDAYKEGIGGINLTLRY